MVKSIKQVLNEEKQERTLQYDTRREAEQDADFCDFRNTRDYNRYADQRTEELVDKAKK